MEGWPSTPQTPGGRDVPSIFSSNQSASSSHRAIPPPMQRTDSQTSISSFGRGLRTRTTSISTASGRTEGALSPDATDRVFPIRSVVHVDPSQFTSHPRESSGGYFALGTRPTDSPSSQQVFTHGQIGTLSEHTSADPFVAPRKSSAGDEQYHLASQGQFSISADAGDNNSQKSGSVNSASGATRPPSSHRSTASKNVDPPGGLYTARFKHVVTEDGHAVITGRDGETLQRCEDEPIHIPGAVQSFGLLMALKEDSEGRLEVRIVSENAKRFLGYTPKQLFELESFTDILTDDQADNLLDHIDFVKDEGTDVDANGPEVFTLSVRFANRRVQRLWCAVHISDRNPDLFICEFELEDDKEHPLVPNTEDTPEPPEDTLNGEPTHEELRESTEVSSRPLRVLRSARKRRGEAAAMEVFNIMSQVQEQLSDAPNLDKFLKVLVGVVKELTGFHRVMIYQFDSSWNGKVVTELVDPRATKDLYKGLHFPASDIPKQARDLYKVNKVRLLYDRSLETARLVCRTTEDLKHPLDMTHAYLRAMSPIHIKYLENMAVRSSMSISINAFGELWGLISCHAYGAKGTRVSFPIRKMCRLVGDSASRNIERLSYASRLQARKIINTAGNSKNPSGYIIASSDDLLKLFDADFGLLSIYDETKILGKLEGVQEALALLEYLRVRRFTSVMTSQDIRNDFPDLRYTPGFVTIAGLLIVPLSAAGNDFIVFFRKGQLREVKWAGNPYEKYIKEGTEGYLEPRKSFKSWTEKVVGKARDWTEEEVETAAVLCLVYGKFIEVWRQKEAALQNTQLTKLLLANSAHEVRTPLNAIINYLEIALEGSLDQETRENLAKSHSASKSLIYVINDLLDLTKTESSDKLISNETFDLKATYNEAVQMFASDAKRKNIGFDVTESPDLPHTVIGDQRRVRQAISNIVANAVRATNEGGVKVDIYVIQRNERKVEVEIVVEDTGSGMSSATLDTLFAELEQAQTENQSLVDEVITGDRKTLDNQVSKKVLGLGLAVVARIVRNMQGQLRLKSEEGKGSRFVIQFPFDLPESEAHQHASTSDAVSTMSGISQATSVTEIPSPHLAPEGEVTLIDKATPRRNSGGGYNSPRAQLSRRNSADSFGSAGSHHSQGTMQSGRSIGSAHSGRSDADRLIEAMQEPTMRMQSSEVLGTPKQRQGRHNMSSNSRSSALRGHSPSPSRRPGIAPAKIPPPHMRSAKPTSHGQQPIQDQAMPLSALKMPTDLEEPAIAQDLGSNSAGNLEKQADYPKLKDMEDPPKPNGEKMRVLIAEDDPINSRIIQKRLQKMGHQPYLTTNGEECASIYGEKPGHFDCVLMDMQMPIVDGLTSTKMIRSYEKSHPTHMLSDRASLNGRIPIIAVSASLLERERQMYIDGGFDGWILKPVSFDRLNELMKGIVDDDLRHKNLYAHGQWEKGGWFGKRQPDVYAANTAPQTNKIVPSGPSNKVIQAVVDEEGAHPDPAADSPHQQQQRAMGTEIAPAVVEPKPEESEQKDTPPQPDSGNRV